MSHFIAGGNWNRIGPRRRALRRGSIFVRKKFRGLRGVLQAQDVGDAHVRLHREDKPGAVCATQFSSVEAEAGGGTCS